MEQPRRGELVVQASHQVHKRTDQRKGQAVLALILATSYEVWLTPRIPKLHETKITG